MTRFMRARSLVATKTTSRGLSGNWAARMSESASATSSRKISGRPVGLLSEHVHRGAHGGVVEAGAVAERLRQREAPAEHGARPHVLHLSEDEHLAERHAAHVDRVAVEEQPVLLQVPLLVVAT